MNKLKLVALVLFVFSIGMQAQDLLTPSTSFSHKKTAYLTLVDGTEVTGTIKDIDRKKGLIESIKIKDEKGKKREYKPEEVQFMYLPPSGLDKMSKVTGFMFDAQKWNDDKMNEDFLNQGLVYFELADVTVKKKDRKLMMQLLNPGFSKFVQIYHDPFAKETMGLGVAGVKVAGGHAKSYYVSKENGLATRMKKKDYKEQFDGLWGDCDKIAKDYPEIRWKDLVKHTISYSECKE